MDAKGRALRDIDVVVIDNDSSDETTAFCEQYLGKGVLLRQGLFPTISCISSIPGGQMCGAILHWPMVNSQDKKAGTIPV